MNSTGDSCHKMKSNQNIQVYLRVRPTNTRERLIRSNEIVEVSGCRDIIVKQTVDSRTTKKFSFDRAFGMDSQQVKKKKHKMNLNPNQLIFLLFSMKFTLLL